MAQNLRGRAKLRLIIHIPENLTIFQITIFWLFYRLLSSVDSTNHSIDVCYGVLSSVDSITDNIKLSYRVLSAVDSTKDNMELCY